MSVSPRECGVCHEEYNENSRAPRILACSHTLCSACIERLISDDKKECPFCRRHFNITSSSEAIMNHSTLDFMRYLNQDGKVNVDTRRKKIVSLKCDMLQSIRQHLLDCQEMQHQTEKNLEEAVSLHHTITQEKVRIERDIMPEIQNTITDNNGKLTELQRMKARLSDQSADAAKQNRMIKEIYEKLEAITGNRFEEICCVLDEVEDKSGVIIDWLDEARTRITEDERTLRINREDVETCRAKMKLVHKVLTQDGSSSDSETEDLQFPMIRMIDLQRMTPCVRHLVDAGKLYAVQEFNGRQRFSRISFMRNNSLCLHSLSDEPVADDIITLNHADIVRLGDHSCRVTFLELVSHISGQILGTLWIRLFPCVTYPVPKFLHLCIGDWGCSYLNGCFNTVDYKGRPDERVLGGVRFYDETLAINENFTRPWRGGMSSEWKAGLVRPQYGNVYTFGFEILTRDRRDAYAPPSTCIGMVERGMDVLLQAIEGHENVKDITINDCGIVLFRF